MQKQIVVRKNIGIVYSPCKPVVAAFWEDEMEVQHHLCGDGSEHMLASHFVVAPKQAWCKSSAQGLHIRALLCVATRCPAQKGGDVSQQPSVGLRHQAQYFSYLQCTVFCVF
jgi:hypothetical protein